MVGSSSKAFVSTVMDNARAVAVILGHLGASRRELEGYARELYHTRRCSTIGAASPVVSFFIHRYRPTAVAIIQEAASVLRQTPTPVPLVVHLFSNGGAFLLEEMEVVLEETKNANSEFSVVSREDAELVSSRLALGYQFFDSCPCYLHNVWHLSYGNQAFPNKKWSTIGRSFYFAGSAVSLSLWLALTFEVQRPHQAWTRMEESTACRHQLYVYTTADMLSDASRVDALVETRRQRGMDVQAYRYEDSNHVRLWIDHSDEYGQIVERALKAACDRATLSLQSTE